MIEVHQTEARNSFQMKTLRGFTAVAESKIHYGDSLISVNILFGDPAAELPESNVKALCGYFDINAIPRYASEKPKLIKKLETVSLQMAGDEDLSVAEAVEQVALEFPEGVNELSRVLKNIFAAAKVNGELARLWQLETKRTRKLGVPPAPGNRSYYKRNILRSLFFNDLHFQELLTKIDPSDYSAGLANQLVRCKLARWEEQIHGDVLLLDPDFAEFLRHPDALKLRDLSKGRFNADDAMNCFFEDIRDLNRRKAMCEFVLDIIEQEPQDMADLIHSDLRNKANLPILHTRCWIADLLPLFLGKSHNDFNRLMYQDAKYKLNLGNPFNNIAIKSDRLGTDKDKLKIYSDVAVSVFYQQKEEVGFGDMVTDPALLEAKLHELRIDAAIKLQKLNPLYLVLESVCQDLGLSCLYSGTPSIISDLANAVRGAGKFDLYHITDGKRTIIANAVAVKDQNGDHKSKEWGARRRAVGYRMKEGHVRTAEFDEALFILDGDWEPKHVERLHRSGWTRIIRLDKVEETLRDIFSIDQEQIISLPEEEPLPLAAEKEPIFKIDDEKSVSTKTSRII